MRSLQVSLVLAIAAVAGAVSLTLVSRPSTGCDAEQTLPCVRVLFIGNSYTYENDLPGTFRSVGMAAHRSIAVGMVANGGETLSQHAASDETRSAINDGHWTIVVLQEQSEIPAIASERTASMFPAAEALVVRIRAAGALPVLLETWAHRDGLPDAGMYEAQMQQAIDDAYEQLGNRLGATVARAGDAWTAALRRGTPPDSLWQVDGSHPTVAGTHLAACAVYGAVFEGAAPPAECA
jgi:hypothetical protein